MHIIRTMKLFLRVNIIIFLIIGFLSSTNFIAVSSNGVEDGIWTDEFEDDGNINFIDNKCELKGGFIQLAAGVEGLNYDFTSGSHKAYEYQLSTLNQFIFSFFYPLIYTPHRLDNPLNPNVNYSFHQDSQYNRIKDNDDWYADSESTEQSVGVVQHFRFKLQGDTEDIGNLIIRWYGTAVDAQKIEMYYLDYSSLIGNLDYSTLIGRWIQTNSTSTILTTKDTYFYYNLSQTKLENAISKDNYIDICIVAVKKLQFGDPCKLRTNYINLTSQQKGYITGDALVQTKAPIVLPSNCYWELLAWKDIETTQATIRYQILYEEGSTYVLIENSVLNGNNEGFTNSTVSLASLRDNYPKIKIQAVLNTSDSAVTPKIDSWSITWQSEKKWQDNFTSELRIEQKEKVEVNNGVSINLLSGDWPMFGQNPGNTRTSTGKAADANSLYWSSQYHSPNETCGNMVVDSNVLYIPTINQNTGKGSLYRYSPILVDSGTFKQYPYSKIIEFSYLTETGEKIIGSPAVSDRYIIVATGDLNTPNNVYAFDKNTPSSHPVWTFDFKKYWDSNICYWGSPIIAEGKVFITSWNGQPDRKSLYTNNKIIVLDLSTGEHLWNYTFPSPPLLSNSPTWSFSTPAYSEGKIVVGCISNKSYNLFAFESDRDTPLWNLSLGSIGKSSPVIYNNTVYIINEKDVSYGYLLKQTQVTAVNINNGTISWKTVIGQPVTTLNKNIDFTGIAQCTPAIANGILYATSPDGTVTALDLSKNGDTLWTYQVYSILNPLDNPILTSSPVYADGILYVGTPNGWLYGLNTLAKGNPIYKYRTFTDTAVITDPVVVDGLVFFGGKDGIVYVCGKYIASSQQISGSITSVPIYLPIGFKWNKFYATVETNASTNINKITFSLRDANNNILQNLQNKSDITVNDVIVRLHADFWAKNNTVNPKLFSWNLTFSANPDTVDPFINMSTLNPNLNGWITEIPRKITVKAQDNNSGLLVNSAEFTLGYIYNNQTSPKYYTTNCECSGVNGSTAVEQITINLSKLSFFDNITMLHSLRINIMDIAGNTATKYIVVKEDKTKPTSFINNQLSMKSQYNASTKFIWINVSSFDNGTDASGVKQVQLFYRYSLTGIFSGSWITFSSSSKTSPIWKFNFTGKNQNGGYFELCSVATDNAGNNESFPIKGDVSFLYDWTLPYLPKFSGDILWFKERLTSTTLFEDDFRLDTIQYRPNFEDTWTTIATNINASTYDTPWSLKEEYWNQMNEGEIYYLYFKINDTLGNTLLVTQNSQAINIRKDTLKPIGTIDIPSLETETSTSNNFAILGFVNDQQDGSGIKEVTLFYRFSKDKLNWSSWTQYEDTLNSSPFEWDFVSPEGEGFYEFRINVSDVAGNAMNSAEYRVRVINFTFPVSLMMIMICLLVILSLISMIILLKWRKT